MNPQSEMTIDEILQEFDGLDSWDDRCDFLIDLGFELPDFPEEEKTEKNRVHGCQSNVWMLLDTENGNGSVISIRADSDAMIVRGLIAVLLAIYSGKTAEEILATDVRAIFSQLGLDRHLSPMRRNGLNGMVKRIRDFAEQTISS
ncbi:MAG: SufE family protein [Planctomycetaceae bacterium]